MGGYSEAFILAEIARFAWALARVSALFMALPIFTGHSVPMRVRALFAIIVTFALLPTLPPMPEVQLLSVPGLFIIVQQVLIGTAIGFVLHMMFAAIIFGGQNVAYGMGLGFASLVDPMTGVQVPVISQFYQLLATLLFLSLDGHLLIIKLLAESFKTIPVGFDGLSRESLRLLTLWASHLLAAGLLLSLPLIAALLLINLGFGVASRAAPQLNIFSVGFPITLLLGLVLLGFTLPDVLTLFTSFLNEGYGLIARILENR